MIIQSYDLFLASGAPQATPGEGQGETHGADTFVQFLAQDVETLGALVALLAPFSPSPTHPFPLQPRLAASSLDPSSLAPANVDDIWHTEQENRALEDVVNALQTLLPAMLPSIPQAPFVTVTEGVVTLSTPQDGVERLAGLPQDRGFPLHATDPILVTVAEGAVSVPAGRDQTAVPAPRASLVTDNLAGALYAETPESGNTERTSGAANPPPGHRANAPATVSPLSISTHPAQEDEMTLRDAGRAGAHGGAHATASQTDPWPQTRLPASIDTGALMSEESSPVHKVQAPSLSPSSTETVPVSSAAFAEVGSSPIHNGAVRLGAEQSTAADLPVQARLPGQQDMGSLRYVPVFRGTVLLQLEPPDLGTLLVQVRQVNEQLTASFWAESSDVRSLLQAHFPALNQVLSQQGFAVQQISLHLATGNGFAEQFGQFSQQHGASQTFSHGNRGEGSGGRRSALDSPAERYQVGNGRVDIRI